MDSSMPKPKLTPKDFVLYAGAMIALYVSVFSLLALLFNYVDYSFRDALDYIDPYNGAMRAAMASLIVFFPLFVWLTRVLNQGMRADSSMRESGFRRWILYITLLIAGLAMAIDLVVLINTFLGGEITTRFILKVIAVLVVAASVFGYYLADLRGYWQQNESKSKAAGAVALAAVIISIVAGFFIMGSPASQRLLRFDEQRVSDLQNMQWQLVNYWQAKQKLPESLGELTNSIAGFTVPKDPETGADYTYSVVGGGAPSFKLCATFSTDSSKTTGRSNPIYAPMVDQGIKGGNTWDHGTGNVCFDRTIDPDFYPPINAPTKGVL